MTERRILRFEAEALVGLELPYFVARGDEDGPRVTLLAGVHGCEYSAIAAAVRFMRALATSTVRGVVTAVPSVEHTAVASPNGRVASGRRKRPAPALPE